MVSGALLGTIAPADSVAHDAIVDLRVNRSLIHADARTPRAAGLHGFTEALNHVRLSGACLVLQRDQKTAVMGLVEVVVVPGPGVDVNHSARDTTMWRACPMPSANTVSRKNRRATSTRCRRPGNPGFWRRRAGWFCADTSSPPANSPAIKAKAAKITRGKYSFASGRIAFTDPPEG